MKSSTVAIGDSGLASQYNNLREDARASSYLLAHEQSSPDLTLDVEDGNFRIGKTTIAFAGGSSPSFTAPSVNPRIDLLVINSSGTLSRVAGTEAASPVVPAIPSDKIVIAEVFNRVGQTSIKDVDDSTNGYIQKDARPFLKNDNFKLDQDGSVNYAADAEASDSYVITLTPAPTAYTVGMVINFKANTANTGVATLNVNGLGAKTIKRNHDDDLSNNDIEANQIVTVIYDGTNFQMQSQIANIGSSVNLLGDGADGDVTIAGTTTLTEDMYYNNLTIQNGGILKPNGFKVFVRRTLTIDSGGIITASGGDGGNGGNGVNGGSGSQGGSAGSAGSQANTTGSIKDSLSSVDGGAGGNGNPSSGDGLLGSSGNAGSQQSNSLSEKAGSAGGSSGNGGDSTQVGSDGGAGASGGGGGATASSPVFFPRTFIEILRFLTPADFIFSSFALYASSSSSGSGAGGGGGGGVNSEAEGGGAGGGGGAGACGGTLFIAADSIINNGLIDACGGAGGAGGAGGDGKWNGGTASGGGGGGGGGGAGGAGGAIYLSFSTKAGSGTETVAGGAGGAGGAKGSLENISFGSEGIDGVAGSNGLVGIIVETDFTI